MADDIDDPLGAARTDQHRRFARPQRLLPRDPLDWIALIAAVVWLGIALWGRPVGDYGVETDFYGDFAPYARAWMRGEPSVMNGFRGPLYYLTLGTTAALVRDAFLAGKLLAALSAALGLRILGGLLARMFGKPAAVFGALFVAANATFVDQAVRASTDSFYWLLSVSALALMVDAPRRWMRAGLCAGAAYLTRYNGSALLAIGLVTVLIAERPRAAWARASARFALGWLVVAVPWLVYVRSQTGDPFWNQAFQNVAVEVYVAHPAVAQDGDFKSAVGFASLPEVLRVDPAAASRALGRNLYRHLWHDARDLVGLPWAAAAVAGLALSARSWRRRSAAAFAAAGALTYASTLGVFYGARFMMPLLPWWAAGIGGLATLVSADPAGAAGRRTGWRLPVLGVLLVALAVVTQVRMVRSERDPSSSQRSPRELVELARAVRGAKVPLDASTPIAARKPHLASMLGVPNVPLQGSSVSDLRERGARYLLVTLPEMRAWPALRDLLDHPQGVRWASSLRLVARTAHAGSDRPPAALFEILDALPYREPPKSPPHTTKEVLAGLDRLETLRLRLAQWYLKWEPGHPLRPLLARMGDSARHHPEVLRVQGEVAMRARDVATAEGCFGQATTLTPQSEPAMLCLAGALMLRGQQAEFDAVMARVLAMRKPDAAPGPQDWWDVGTGALGQREFTAAIAPLTKCVELAGVGSPCGKLLGKTFIALGWTAEARHTLTAYRSANPADPEPTELLKRLGE